MVMPPHIIPLSMSLLYRLFPLACIVAIPSGKKQGLSAERFVFGIALYEFLLVSFGLLLGLSHHLTVPAFRETVGAATLLLALLGLRNGLSLPPLRVPRLLRTRRGAALAAVFLVAGGALLLELWFDTSYGTRHGDGLWYHIPRVMFWMQQGDFRPWVTPVAASIGLPVAADLVLLHQMLLGNGWGGAAWVTLLLTVGGALCVYLAARDFRFSRFHASLAAAIFLSFPAVGLRVWSINSDIAAAFPVLASFVALQRLRNPKLGLPLFLVLNAMAIACKPTVAPPAILLACFALWRCREKLVLLKESLLPYLSFLLGTLLVAASYWPVYVAFGDFLGGDYSRAHRSSDSAGFLHAVAMHTGYWLMEPLGYLTRFREGWQVDGLTFFYNLLGAGFAKLPEMWKPYPGQDTGFTGIAPTVLLLPLLLYALPRKARLWAIPLFLLGYLPLSGMITPQPYFTRYNVILLAGVALLWVGSELFRRGKRRWLILALVGVNCAALLGIVGINAYLQLTDWSREGGLYYYISEQDRDLISKTLDGRPLLVLTESSTEVSSMDALLTGPDLAFPLRYQVCPDDGDWVRSLRDGAGQPGWLALVHNGRESIIAGPDFERPGVHSCPSVPLPQLREYLQVAGWSRHRRGRFVDLWKSGAGVAGQDVVTGQTGAGGAS